jgi:hypothetical protein
MTTPVVFGEDNLGPLSTYMTEGMYFTLIPITYLATTTQVNIYVDNVHMPYSYDLPNLYLTIINSGNYLMSSAN